MSRRGQVFSNPVTGERAVILTDPADRNDRVLVAHLFVRPGGRVVAEHFHPTITECFHVLTGEVGFLIDGHERRLGPGELAEIAPNVRHDWWQVGEEEAQVIVEVAPGDHFFEIIGTTFGLARDGKTTEEGLPHPLQGAVSLHAYREVVVFTKPPIAAQRLMFPPLALLGRAMGRRPSYPEYAYSDETAELDPTALAQLDADGRLISSTAAGG